MVAGHRERSSERQAARRGSLGTRWVRRGPCQAALAVVLLALVLPQVAAAGGLGFSFTPSDTEPYAVCGRATPGHAACLAILVPSAGAQSMSVLPQAASPATVGPSYTGSGVGGGYAPSDLRSAYDLPSTSEGSGQTVAIVDAYDDPDAESDLGVYRSRYGISACTTANGCFRKVNQSGGSSYPTANASWAVEISLDLDMVSAACPNCHILLVEASTNANNNLYAAEDEAVALGATEVSNSWGGPEESGETSDDSYFHHEGVPITASAGDSGYEVEYPAASPYVIAVGGTSLSQASNSRGWSESAWGETATRGTGSGCSAYETKPAWQTDAGCSRRTNNDIAAVASPQTPVSVADSYELPKEFAKPEAGWTLAGGTSTSSPLIAGTMALANAYTRSLPGAEALYEEAAQNGTGVLDDVTSGSNGTCGNYLCNAGPGYDGPTGLGSPYGAPVVTPTLPTVLTKAASSVTQTTATLNATVNPNGWEVTECKLEYGTTTSYGSSAPCAPSPGSGSTAVAVSASLTGLSANTTYHFRISATNAGGTSKGSDEMAKTLPNGPAVITKAASSVAQTTATVSATVNPNGGDVTKCEFEYGTTTSYGSTAPCTPSPGSGSTAVAVSASLTGLTASTTYHFRISATNAGGTSRGSDETLTTPPNAPAVVTGTASSLAQTTATLSATVNPDGGDVSECKLEYGTTTSYGSSAPCTPSPGSGSSPVAVSASLTGLTANSGYHFRISATNAGGTSKGSDEAFTTLPNAPAVVTKAASSPAQTTATLNATVNPNGGAVSKCELEYGSTTSYGSSAPCTPSPGSGTTAVTVSASLTGLSANTTYHFRISATNAGGTSKGSDETFRTLPAGPSVATQAASALTQTTATLNATVTPNGGEVSECKLEYGTTTSYGSSATCAPAPGSGSAPVAVSASLTGLSANTTYHFRISATNAGGMSKGSDETFTTLPNAPAVVTKAASAVTQTTATLNATVNPNGGPVSKCELEYGTTTSYGSSAPCTPSPGSGSSPVAVSASLTGLSANTTYHFRISATNAGGTSKGSDEALTTLPNLPAAVTKAASAVTQTTATLNATVTPNGGEVTECKLEYGTTTSYGSSAPCTPSPGSGSSPVAVSASLTGLTANTTYHFRISATNAGGTSRGSDEAFTTLPNAPAVVTGTASSLAQTTATLSATVNPNGGDVSECKLEYGTTTSYGSSASCSSLPGSGSSPVAVSASLTGLTANTTYHFRISATNAGGTSRGSDETFKTAAPTTAAPSVETGAASSVTQTAAVLNATVNPNGDGVSECDLEYGITISYGSSVPCTASPGADSAPVAVSASLTGLSANTTYHFRISAISAGGTRKGSDVAFTTLPDSPAVVTGAASFLAQNSATVTATVNPNGGELSECALEYGATPSLGSSAPCSVPPGASSAVTVSAPLEGLSAGTTYYFRIVAANQGGTSSGAEQTLTTLLPATLQQQGPGGEEASSGPAVAPAPETAAPPVPDAKLSSTALTVSLAGAVGVRVSCPAGVSRCAGTVMLQTLSAVSTGASDHSSIKLRAAVLTLARGSFTVAGGQASAVTLHLSARARKLLARAHVLRVQATVVAHDAAGATHTTRTIVTLRVHAQTRGKGKA